MFVGFFLTAFLLLFLFAATIPLQCWEMMRQNSCRLDGSYSVRRGRREHRALAGHAGNLLLPALLIGLIVFLSTTFFFERVMPVSILMQCVVALDTDPDQMEAKLQQVRKDHAAALRADGRSTADIVAIQRSLRQDWPSAMVSVLVFLVVAFVAFVRVAAGSVQELVTGIRDRRRVYARADVAEMRDQADEIRLREMSGSV